MNHEDAIREMAVEQYLLGELSGASLDRFEEHLFDCQECAAELKAGSAFLEAARLEFKYPGSLPFVAQKKSKRWSGWLTAPWVLGPALAVCLLVIAVQTLVLLPRMKHELAQVETPAVVNSVVLASAGARGDSVAKVVAPQHGSFLLSVDIPERSGFKSYECSLYSPEGALEWQTAVSPQQANDTVLIDMPTDKTEAGLNTLVVQGVQSNAANSSSTDLAKYKFEVDIEQR
jgi:hypothetical protein